MNNRPRQTLMDYMVIAISPALIMAMVGSLLFFLLVVFYHGQYEGRLTFIFAMFVMAIVLIARISMEEGIEYATLFAIPLAIVTMLAMAKFVQIRGPLADYGLPLNALLIAIVWWSAHRLTWDCTLIDDRQDASGEGLLQGMGFDDETVSHQAQDQVDVEEEAEGAIRPQLPATAPSWWQRMIDRRHRPHTPGVWVVYYGLAALPLFALGQWMIPGQDATARMSAFRWLVVYVGSAMGLLLTTSFLGLRRYLRQRNLTMPGDMAGMWLGVGSLIVLVTLLFCMILPRPGATLKISQLPFEFQSPFQERTQRPAWGDDGQQPGEGARRQSETESAQPASDAPEQTGDAPSSTKDQDSDAAGGQRQQSQPDRPEPGGNRQGQPQRTDDGKSADGKPVDQRGGEQAAQTDRTIGQRTDAPPRQDSAQRPAEKAQDPGGQESGDARSPSQRPPQAAEKTRSQSRSPAESSAQDRDEAGTNSPSDSPKQDAGPQPDSSSSPPSEPQAQDSSDQPTSTDRPAPESTPSDGNSSWMNVSQWIGQVLGGMAGLVKLLFWGLLLCGLAYFSWKHRERLWQAISQLLADLRDLLARLLGGGRTGEPAEVEPSATAAVSAKPFADYSDPFLSGIAERSSTEQLVGYTFEALEAWARERGFPRDEEQTPLEFARRVAVDHPNLGHDVQQLADAYSRVAYGRERVEAAQRELLRRLWRQMRATASMPAPPHPESV